MADFDDEQFANPIAPAGHKPQASRPSQPLTNDDFRKLIQTPRVGSAPTPSVRSHHPSSIRGKKPAFPPKEKDSEKQKKRSLTKVLRQQEDDALAELALRYRDRAKERREGANPDYQNPEVASSSASGYRTVAPDSKSDADAAIRRKQMIEESKYLGGDMEHTHLVKGLDYALLQKVKAELQHEKESKSDEEEEEVDGPTKKQDETDSEEEYEDRFAIKSKLAKNIMNVINQKLPERNDMFLPQRMAYIVNLENDVCDDIPTTIIRSRAECPNWEKVAAPSTNDIVINKLIQIWANIRQGGSKKRKLKETPKPIKAEARPPVKSDQVEDSIYGDIGDYVPSFKSKKTSKESKELGSKKSYFGSSKSNEEIDHYKPSSSGLMDMVNEAQKAHKAKLASKLISEPDGYAECYPGALENDDAMMDSDEEADYSKMDAGSKKGAVGRWDFETTEEYSDYMGSKEALPKAAYQFGVKMNDGRKTKKGGDKKKDDKGKIDRDLQKINAIINRRKDERGDRKGRSLDV